MVVFTIRVSIIGWEIGKKTGIVSEKILGWKISMNNSSLKIYRKNLRCCICATSPLQYEQFTTTC